MDNLEVLRGSAKEIVGRLTGEGEYYLDDISTTVITRIDPADYTEGGYIVQFSNEDSPFGINGEMVYGPTDGIIKYDLSNKVAGVSLKGEFTINDEETSAKEFDLILEGVIFQLLKIYERYTF